MVNCSSMPIFLLARDRGPHLQTFFGQVSAGAMVEGIGHYGGATARPPEEVPFA